MGPYYDSMTYLAWRLDRSPADQPTGLCVAPLLARLARGLARPVRWAPPRPRPVPENAVP